MFKRLVKFFARITIAFAFLGIGYVVGITSPAISAGISVRTETTIPVSPTQTVIPTETATANLTSSVESSVSPASCRLIQGPNALITIYHSPDVAQYWGELPENFSGYVIGSISGSWAKLILHARGTGEETEAWTTLDGGKQIKCYQDGIEVPAALAVIPQG